MRFSTAGIEFIFVFGSILAVGFALDQLLELLPVCTVWGGVIGFFSGLYRLLQQAKKARDFDNPEPEEGSSGEEN